MYLVVIVPGKVFRSSRDRDAYIHNRSIVDNHVARAVQMQACERESSRVVLR